MIIHSDFLCEHDEDLLAADCDYELSEVSEKKRDGRNRILRYGWDYLNPNKWIGDLPQWAYGRFTWPDNFPIFDSLAINEYLIGQAISPHIDSAAFGDVSILSLLSDVTMRFVSPTGQVKDFDLPRRSLAVMAGELRNSWQHSTLPLEADRRISIVYRTKL